MLIPEVYVVPLWTVRVEGYTTLKSLKVPRECKLCNLFFSPGSTEKWDGRHLGMELTHVKNIGELMEWEIPEPEATKFAKQIWTAMKFWPPEEEEHEDHDDGYHSGYGDFGGGGGGYHDQYRYGGHHEQYKGGDLF